MIFFLALSAVLHCHLVLCSSDPYHPSVGSSAGGWKPKFDDYPWTVGVHKRKDDGVFEQICGGSLISPRFVLSAAHCFWNNGQDVPLELYRISAGNFYRDPSKDNTAQIKEVKDVIFHERYRGFDLNYAHDIVIVVLKEEVSLGYIVWPIDIDWNSSFEDSSLKGGYGTVVGWGFTERDEPSETRVAVGLPFVAFGDCYDVVPRDFRSSLTPDKFCAGLRNGTAVCPGDSGGGLAFLSSPNNQWYLRGIVSVGVRPKGNSKCHKSQYSVFTSMSHYRTWLYQALSELIQPQLPSEEDNARATEDAG